MKVLLLVKLLYPGWYLMAAMRESWHERLGHFLYIPAKTNALPALSSSRSLLVTAPVEWFFTRPQWAAVTKALFFTDMDIPILPCSFC